MSSTEIDTVWPRLLALAEHRRRYPHEVATRRAEIGSMHPLRAGADGVGACSLYTPLLAGAGPFAVAHLGQSIDGCIATESGHSLYVTGEQNLVHLHRLRALSDAVLVGAGTAIADDPRLTVRRVEGRSPVRVVIDSRGNLPATLGLFNDGGPVTLVVVRNGCERVAGQRDRCIEVAERDGRLSPAAIRSALHERGLACLFVEGGGVTVSDWLGAGALDRLHVAIAPVIIGEGRRGLSLPSAPDMPSALRAPTMLHRMGEDVLFDLDLSPG